MVVDPVRKAVVPAENIETILGLLPSLKEAADTDFLPLTNIDSTNVTPTDWSFLAKTLADERDHYDAFVVTHGTNTLAYTASALAFALGTGFGKPVIVTGSQMPLTVYGNDARFNFENAILTAVVAAEKAIAEVMVVFDDSVLRGVRSIKVSESQFHAFASPSFPPLADIRSTGIQFIGNIQHPSSAPFTLKNTFDSGVLTIDLVPGMLPDMVDTILQSGRCRGLLLKSHGAGSVPTVKEYSFLPLITRCRDQYHIPVLVTTKFIGGSAYKNINDLPAIEAIEAGAISARDMTDVAAQVKLMWLLGQSITSIDDVARAIASDVCGEITAA